LPYFRQAKTALLSSRYIVPKIKAEHLDDLSVTRKTAQAVWVPNRNGLFLNIAAVYAEIREAKYILTGFNTEEAVTFPDNSRAFMKVANQFFSYATANKVKVLGLNMTKEQIVKTALKLRVPLPFVWSCYFGHWRMCGECESCQRLKRALNKNKIKGIVHFTRS